MDSAGRRRGGVRLPAQVASKENKKNNMVGLFRSRARRHITAAKSEEPPHWTAVATTDVADVVAADVVRDTMDHGVCTAS